MLRSLAAPVSSAKLTNVLLAAISTLLLGPLSAANAQCPASFTAGVIQPTTEAPGGGTAGDLNGDGMIDVVVVHGEGRISVFLGGPAGTLLPEVIYAVGSSPTMVAIGDFNGDGKPDLAVTNYGSDNVSILLGNGDGTFQDQVTYGASSGPTFVIAADLNGDHHLDLVIANINGQVSILLGTGDGTFQATSNIPAVDDARAVAVADFNNDGNLDIAVPNYRFADGHVAILLGNGDGTFQAPIFSSVNGPHPHGIAFGDLNGDGKLDLALPNQYNNISILLGNGDGTFQVESNLPVGGFPSGPVLADMNGDGSLDLVQTFNGSIWLFLGNGDGTFQPPTTIDNPAGGGVSIPAAIDLNMDGRMDLTVSSYADHRVGVLLNTPVSNLSIPGQPQNFTTLGSFPAMFSVGVTGSGPFTYQWRRVGGPDSGVLTDNGNISGANSSTLSFHPAALFPNGSAFICTITNACGTMIASDPGVLLLQPGCPADYNQDGVLNADDLSDYITSYFNGCQ